MKVVDDLEQFEKPAFSAVTIGTFDGVHLGHQTILRKVVEEAKSNNGKSILITFWPHPRFILKPHDTALKLLSTFEEKVSLIENLGVDYIIRLEFTPAFSRLSAEEFVKEILVYKIGTKKLFIGYDHHFGNNREGDIAFLKKRSSEYGFDVDEISKQQIDDVGVSSTKIRNALNSGNVSLANSLLGRDYTISGLVIHGNKRGRSIGFPTANLEISEGYKLLPMDGSYAVKVYLQHQLLNGMLNIGNRPTIDGKYRSVEVHLFNFARDIYGEFLKIQFVQYLRPEKKFESTDQLKHQLEKDQKEALIILK